VKHPRLLLWPLLITALTAWLIYSAIAESQANMINDKSSMAWVGFLPFIAPLFLLEAAIYVVPIAIVVELACWLLKR
jgi:hypothetical protein